MSKRFGKGLESESSSPAKRAKLEVPKPPTIPKRPSKEEDDLWGDDFLEEDLEQIDLIASQACSQEVNVSTVDLNHREPRSIVKYGSSLLPGPSTSAGPSTSGLINGRRFTNGAGSRRPEAPAQPLAKHQRLNSDWRPPASQKLGSSEVTREIDDLPTIDQFKGALMSRSNLNSTFQSQVSSQASRAENVDPQVQVLTGELYYWKEKLKKTEMKAEKEKIEKEKALQEEKRKWEDNIKALTKERENLKTQYDLQALQLGSLMEKCKLLETNAVKLVQPSTSAVNSPKNKIARCGSGSRAVKVESSVQVDLHSGFQGELEGELKTMARSYPLEGIPEATFEAPVPEKAVVDVKVVEKIGQKNLPILQEEETFRIFENPELVKPIVTMVDGRQLSTAFFWSDVTGMIRKTSVEINSKDCFPMINKIITITRELLLNATLVLKKIFTAMQNDDIRDMNDLYFSDFYDTQINYSQSLQDANPWYKEERGIEARRAFGTLSYIAKTSNYLSEYITGKSFLITEGDEGFKRLSSQMERYNAWEKRGHEFEMLEMMLEFVTTVGLIRRSHQFAGLICAIVMTFRNAQRRVQFSHRGLKYVGEIFREIVFSRPLLQCFVPLTDVLICFCGAQIFNVKICPSPTEKSAIELWKGAQYFTPNACTLAVFMAQLMRFKLDEVTTIKLAFSMLAFVYKAFLLNNISWPDESNLHYCRTNLLTFTITILYNCSKIDLEKVRSRLTADECPTSSTWRRLDDNFWGGVKRRQFNALRSGIRFLSFLAKRDPDFIVRASDVDDLFQLFMQQVTMIEGFTLHENEREALALITSTIALDKASSGETAPSTPKLFTPKSALKDKSDTTTEPENFCTSSHKSRMKNIKVYKTKL
ncbi:uncharacterized protein LOC107046754 [Diachasma alloeum]|uniref:uncharacterized protein LOC107046754 n=1 Tax=Diachasma alloeum TaxID=454923 RepID=UPI0007381E83|nr:uncharacterized protein LOC107046754 [Diachasma alloeum]